MAEMDLLISAMTWAPSSATFLALTASSLADLAFSALERVSPDISSSAAELVSRAAAERDAPSARDWLVEANSAAEERALFASEIRSCVRALIGSAIWSRTTIHEAMQHASMLTEKRINEDRVCERVSLLMLAISVFRAVTKLCPMPSTEARVDSVSLVKAANWAWHLSAPLELTSSKIVLAFVR
jgi:hypothetical protein